MQGPSRVVFSEHAAERAARYAIPLAEIGDAILTAHVRRRRNRGAGDWQIASAHLTVVYNWPDGPDRHAARVVTLWREE